MQINKDMLIGCCAGRKIFPLCTINCNNRGRSSVYRVNVPNQR